MRKIYSLLAMFLVAMMANAQVITFTETAEKGTLNGKTFGSDGFVLTVTDNVDGGKLVIDTNNANFGTLEDYQSFSYRLKTGGKSSSKNCLSLSIPADGTLKIYARTASKDDPRTVIISQGETEVFNQSFVDSQAATENYTASDGTEKTRTVFPVYTCEVKAGTADITYPDNGVNFYAFELVSNAPAGPSIMVGETAYEIVATETASVTMFANTAYQGISASFATQLANMLAAVGLESATTDQFVQVDNAGVGFAYNKNDGWHAADGSIEGKTWGSEEKLVCVKPWGASEAGDVIDGTINYLGCIDTNWNAGETHVCKFAVINNGKAAVLELTIEFKPVPLEEPTTSYAALNVVKEYEMVLEYTLGGQYEGRTDSLAVEGIYEALGCSAEDLAASADKVFMARIMGTDESSSNVWTDELKPSRFDTDGWFGRYSSYNEATGEETPIVQNAPHGWGAGCTFYLQNAQITDGVFTIKNGQYPGTMKVGDADYAEIFVCNGTKAVKITVKAVVKEPEVDPDQPDDEPEEDVPFDQMTKAGEQNVAIEVGAYDYYPETDVVSFDLDEILNALGASSPEDIKAWVYENESSLVAPSTNDYWQNENGMTEGWNGTATEGGAVKVYFKDSNIQTSKMVVMQRATRYSALEEVYGPFTLKYVFTYGDKYYELNIAYSVNPIKEDKEYKQVATENITKQIIPGTVEYNGTEKTAIDLEYITGAIGTSDFTLYADLHKTAEDGSTTLEWSNNYTCTPAPGFWFGKTEYTNEEGQVVVDNAGWGNNAFGFTYANGTITWYEYPGACTVGENYAANVYFVNEETGAYLKLTINVSYVDEIRPEAETVGEEKVVVEATEPTADGTYKVTLDLSKAYEALEITADEIEAAQIVAPKSQFTFAYFEPEEDIIYDANGYVTTNEEATVAMANLAIEDGTPILTIDPMDIDLTSEEATSVTVRVGLEYNGKRYIHVVTLGNATYTAINGVKSTSNAAAIYTINGVKVNALQKGLNIMKMTDGTVKKVLVK